MHQQAQKSPCVHPHVLLLGLWITRGVKGTNWISPRPSSQKQTRTTQGTQRGWKLETLSISHNAV